MLNSILKGQDACLFTYGQCGNQNKNTMFGSDQNNRTIGIAPLSIYYLFNLIEQIKLNSSRKFVVRMAAIEISNCNNIYSEQCIVNLLNNEKYYDNVSFNKNQLESHTLKCENLEDAFDHFDRAINRRDRHKPNHMFVILYIEQYDNCTANLIVRSKLSLIDFAALSNSNCCPIEPASSSLTTVQLAHFIQSILIANQQQTTKLNKYKINNFKWFIFI